MPTDYEALYRAQRHALGQPTKAFVEFFRRYDKTKADVLDVGCGQGRDALFIGRLGHHVVGVDRSETGVAQLLEDARTEGLNVEGIVADLRDFAPSATFDVAVVDRTLHMLEESDRLMVLARVCNAVRSGGYVLIADEKKNIPSMVQLLESDSVAWSVVKRTGGLLFARKNDHPEP